MADDAKADDATKAAAEGLKKILDVLAPEPADEAPAAPGGPVDEVYGAIGAADVSSSAQGALKAVERYRNAMRWLVGAVAAVGLALFGSVAFTEGELTWARIGGLVAAALGLVLVLWGATTVFEPEDASLGELAADLAKDEGWKGRGLRVGFRRRAMHQLRTILEAEPTAHLGPGVGSVPELIEEIARKEDGRTTAASAVARARLLAAAETERRTAAEEQLKALVDARTVAKDLTAPATEPLDAAIAAAAGAVTAARQDEDAARRALTTALRGLAAIDTPLGRHMLHRSVLLDESAVAQVRGTFRASRLMLLLGAAATLVGTLFYVTSVKEEEPDHVWPGTLEVAAGTKAAEAFSPACVGVELQVVLFADEEPSLGEGYRVGVGQPEECAGTYAVPAKRDEADAVLTVGRRLAVPEDDDVPVPAADAEDDDGADGADGSAPAGEDDEG